MTVRLLIPVDGSSPALRACADVAARARRGEPVEAHLLNVQLSLTAANRGNEILAGYYRTEAEAALAKAKRLLASAGVAHQSTMRVGRAASTIADYAKEASCDEIVMGTRGRGAIGRLALGSVANKVLHLVDIPVTLVR